MIQNEKLINFITLYQLIISNLTKNNRKFQISLYNLDNEFNIQIIDVSFNETIFFYHFKVSMNEYFDLIHLITDNFIDNYDISLSLFDCITEKDSKLYYQSKENSKKPLQYEKAKIHRLRNNTFELKIYYFDGLNEIGYKLQEKALKKMNLNTQKVYKKQTNLN